MLCTVGDIYILGSVRYAAGGRQLIIVLLTVLVLRVWAHFCPLLTAVTGSRFLVNLLTIFFFAFQCDAKKSLIARFIIKIYCLLNLDFSQ